MAKKITTTRPQPPPVFGVDETGIVYVLQTGIQCSDCVRWSWDLCCVYPDLPQAVTERAEFYFEDRLCRIVKMKLVEIEVLQVFETEDLERPVKEVQ